MKNKIISVLRYQAPAFIWALIIFVASSIPTSMIPWAFLRAPDKIIHVVIFLILGILVYRALETDSDRGIFFYKKVLLMFGIVLSYGILDELHQGFTPGRSVDFYDLLADAVGGITAGAVLYLRGMRNIRKTS